MNKQELIGKIIDLPYEAGVVVDTLKINRAGLIKLIDQLDEPKEVVVSQFVADWYEEHKDDFEIALFRCIDHIPSVYDEGDLNEFEEWIIDGETKPFQTLVNMHQFGYEVEKEKRYLVKMKGVTDQTRILKRNIDIETWYFGNPTNYEDVNAHHTRKELEQAGFGWVFDCPGIEIEEVE